MPNTSRREEEENDVLTNAFCRHLFSAIFFSRRGSKTTSLEREPCEVGGVIASQYFNKWSRVLIVLQIRFLVALLPIIGNWFGGDVSINIFIQQESQCHFFRCIYLSHNARRIRYCY